MLYIQCFYSTAQTLTSDISISTKMDMYHYKTDTTCCLYNSCVLSYLLVISGICGILCWAAGSGSTVQYNLSWSFGFAISSVIISVVPAFFLTMERISNSQIKRRDSLEEPEKIQALYN